MRNKLVLLGLALTLAGGSLAVAGCGGSAKSSAARTATHSDATPDASLATQSPELDCSALDEATTDLEMSDATGGGLDYVRDRDFMDGYADRAPREIADSVRQLRDVLDKFASAAQQIGLKPGKDPLPDQLDQLKSSFHFSADEQADNGRAVETVTTWVMNGCAS